MSGRGTYSQSVRTPKAGDSGRRKAESPPDDLRSSGKSAAGISGIPSTVGPTSAIGSTSSAKAAVTQIYSLILRCVCRNFWTRDWQY